MLTFCINTESCQYEIINARINTHPPRCPSSGWKTGKVRVVKRGPVRYKPPLVPVAIMASLKVGEYLEMWPDEVSLAEEKEENGYDRGHSASGKWEAWPTKFNCHNHLALGRIRYWHLATMMIMFDLLMRYCNNSWSRNGEVKSWISY